MSGRSFPVRASWRVPGADSVQDLAWSPDGRWLAAAAVEGPILLIDAATGDVSQHWPGHAGGALALSWSRESLWLASSGQNGCVHIWNPLSDTPVLRLDCGNSWVGGVRFSPHADLLAAAAGRELRAWDVQGRLLHSVKPHASTIAELAWHPQQPVLASVAYGKAHLWDWTTPDAPSDGILPHPAPLLNARWSPDGRYLACGCQDGSVRCWTWPDLHDFQMSGYTGKVRALAWDHATRWLAVGDCEVVTLWDFANGPPTGDAPLDVEGLTATVQELAFQPGGHWLAAGDQNGQVIVWNLDERGYQRLWQSTLRGGCERLAWHPRKRLLALGGGDGAISVFEFEP